ncbi:hypothetical protein HW260_00825 [Helicobacter cinaedi]|uniref:Uncharacterized protein n=2 Tax=Helicobacter cinaedi TaxID=213 RepID=A0AAI8MPS1_9HELI|nr:hypothetical protein [Helicobacter cinaedi]QOQ91809.1 hypothetical protein HW260_00825 [Helicobacter cinaedi]BAM33136.1 hypothetical protein HCBAA847_1918 [Helicobacter cinaedi CCUG 18818 = ATCC BAA-847]
MCVLGFVLVFGGAEELVLHETNTESPANPLTKQLEKKESEENQGAKVSKNLSIKADAFVNDGYSEMELETGKANLNELDTPMSRYGAGVELNYSVKPDSRVELELFVSNTVELNTQRRGGKIKAYDTVQRYEENAYNYGNKVMYPAWVNSIGMKITILKTHRIMLTLKQTQLSTNDALLAMSASQGMPQAPLQTMPPNVSGMPIVGNVASNTAVNANPYVLTTQVFLTYSYTF